MDTATPDAATDTRGPAGRRRRRIRLVVLLLVFFLVTGAVSAAVAKYRGCQEPPPATGGSVAFAIPSGATGQDVVAALDQRGMIRCGGFVGNLLLRKTGKAGKILAGTAEGFLFPDTYQLVKKGLTADGVIRRMLTQFETEARSLDLAGGAERLGFSPYQVVIVASMIEREAQVEGDRTKIASVIYNRL